MPGNAFIKFEGVAKGESYDEGHPGSAGWIELEDWTWDIEAETSFAKGGGAAVGKAAPSVFGFSHSFDLASPVIMGRIVKGTHFSTVTVEMCKQTGDDKPQVFFKIVMKEVFTTKVANAGESDGSVKQSVEMVCKEILVEYTPQTNTGALGTAIPFEWNVAANKLVQ